MKLQVIDTNKIEYNYYGDDKLECIANLIENGKQKLAFRATIESVSDMLGENVSQMTNDEDIAISALEAVSKGFGYKIVWEEN